MKSISTGMRAHLDSGATDLANCWKITRLDGVVHAFTTASNDLLIENVTYQAAQGFTRSSLVSATDGSVGNMEFNGQFEVDDEHRREILEGRWDGAAFEYFTVCWSDLALGIIPGAGGTFGQVTFTGEQFRVELRSLSQSLQQASNSLYQASCRVQLGDPKCGIDVAALAVTGTFTGVTDGRTLVDTARTETDNAWQYGTLTITSGEASGFRGDVKASTSVGVITLYLPLGVTPAVGDAYELRPGCGGDFQADCITRYDNARRFQGEPYLVGNKSLYRSTNT